MHSCGPRKHKWHPFCCPENRFDFSENSPVFHKTLWFMLIYDQTKFCCKRMSSFEEKGKSNILIIWVLTKWHFCSWWCVTILSLARIFFCSEDIMWTNLHCYLDRKNRKAIFSEDTPAYCYYYQTKFGCRRISSTEDVIETIIFRSYEPPLWPSSSK